MKTRFGIQQENISVLQAELAEARARLAGFKRQRIENPSDTTLREPIKRSIEQIAALEDELEVATEILEATRKHDASTEGTERRKHRKAAAAEVLEAHSRHRAASAKVDAAAKAFTEVLAEWRAGHEGCKAAGRAYTSLTDMDGDNRRKINENFLATPGSTPYAIAKMLHEFARAAGIELGDYVTWNQFAITGRSAPMPLVNAASYYTDRAASTLNDIEARHHE